MKSPDMPRKKKSEVTLKEGEGFRDNMTREEASAKAVIRLPLQASETFQRLVKTDNGLDTAALIRVMKEIGKEVSAGKMDYLEQTLVSQVVVLDALFNNLTMRALGSEFQKNFENILKLAFKAQSQARCTAEALALIKNPQPYVRQVNVAQGHQQVNNSYPTTSSNADARGESQNEPNKLLEVNHGDRLDTRAPTAACRADSEMEALA